MDRLMHTKQKPEINTSAQTNLVHNKGSKFKHCFDFLVFHSDIEIKGTAKRKKKAELALTRSIPHTLSQDKLQVDERFK